MAKNIDGKVKARTSTIRLRTWTLTATIAIALILYFLVQVGWNDTVNFVDLIFVSTIQVVVHCLYFPDGDIFGQKAKNYIRNKTVYNVKATAINENRKVADLRQYCLVEYEERQKRYILNVCGAIGITYEEYEQLKSKSEKEIKNLKVVEMNGKIVHLTKQRRRWLYRLIFKPLPIEPNEPETILSAVENNTNHAITDGAVEYKTHQYIKRIIQSFIVGTFLAYIGYSARDGITLAIIVKTFVHLVSIFTTAVLSFSRGEACSSVYKNKFYIDLSNFIDGFYEWLYSEKKVDIKVEIPAIE